jgi:hypothetical protein
MVNGHPDDPSIANGTALWRWVRPDVIVRDPKRPSGWRLSSQAFEDSKDGTPCSVVLRAETWTLEEAVRRLPGYGIAEIRAGRARELNQRVLRHYDPDMPGHAYMAGAKPRSVLKSLAEAGRWVAGPKNWDSETPIAE